MEKAPYNDYDGNPIHEGDKIKHPSGEIGIVKKQYSRKYNRDIWVVDYGEPWVSRLSLQVGSKGRAVISKGAI